MKNVGPAILFDSEASTVKKCGLDFALFVPRVVHFQIEFRRHGGVHMARDRLGSERSHKPLIWILVLMLVAFAAFGFFRVGGTPTIKIEPAMPAIGKRTPLKVEVSEPRRGLTRVKVELQQGDKKATLAEKTYPLSSQFFLWRPKTDKDILTVEAGQKVLPSLAGGTAAIRVTAGRAGTWLRHPDPKVEEMILPVRLIPPSLQVTSTHTYVEQGGCEVVTYRIGESAVRDGVRAGSWWFPGYALPGGGKQDRFAFFAVPYDMDQPEVRLVVEDAAGNEAERFFVDKFFPKRLKSDNINVTDAFIDRVVPEILSQTPELKDSGNLLDNYLAINRDLRKKNSETLESLARKSKPDFLWSRPFLMMPNGKAMASFGERRTYLYQGRVIDHQDHLGYDLAVTRQAPIPAGNDGIVVYAGFLGIYGNAVVIDHGYGLQSIYGHMSSIVVSEGQAVSRGEIIGKTGETGLAGGDHLHFCTLLQGLPVDPVEWWDGHWIKDRIAGKLGQAFPFQLQ
jgi:murein DD-endopeptidase MepM/ murein hydrolase activator NlpD